MKGAAEVTLKDCLKVVFVPVAMGEGGGRGKSFIRGGSAPRSNPLPLHILAEKGNPFIEKRYAFHIRILANIVHVFM